MNSANNSQAVATTASASWLFPLRLVFLFAWIFNVVLLTALFWSAWKNDQTEKLLCMAFFLAWLLGLSGWIAAQAMRRRPVVRMGT
jgi:hypothetical protein